MTPYQQMARAFQIFDSYDGDQGVGFYDSEVNAGPDPAVVSAEHLVELEALGWHANDGEECFYSFNRC